MTAKVLAAALVAATLGGCATAGLEGAGDSTEVSITRFARSGERKVVSDYRTYRISLGCATTSLPEVSILKRPLFGEVDLATAPAARFFGNESRERSACRGVSGPTMVVYYTSRRGFRGHDFFSYRVRFKNGETRHVEATVQVR